MSADAFVSDTDKWALEKLKKIPLLPLVISKFYEYGLDRGTYCMNMSMSVRCGPKQFKTLHEILLESCHVLDMPVPELYITNNPFPNAFAGGVERPYITLRSSMVETMTDEQLFYLIGHELGHIKAKHVLYFSVGFVLKEILELIGRRTFGTSDVATYALLMAFAEWSRQAEFSADRAGLLVCQEVGVTLDAMITMTAGRTRLSHEVSREAFMDQARAYQDADAIDEFWKIMIFILYGTFFTHPMPVHRAQELERWVLSGKFDDIMAGRYEREKEAVAS